MDKIEQDTMIGLVNEWKQSGMSIRVFAQKNGVSKSKFEYWVRKDKAGNTVHVQYPRFVEVTPMAENRVLAKVDGIQMPTPPNPQIVLTFPSGLCLKIYG